MKNLLRSMTLIEMISIDSWLIYKSKMLIIQKSHPRIKRRKKHTRAQNDTKLVQLDINTAIKATLVLYKSINNTLKYKLR